MIECSRCSGALNGERRWWAKVGGLTVCHYCVPYYIYPMFCDNATDCQSLPVAPLLDGERTIGIEIEGNFPPDDAYAMYHHPFIATKKDGSLRGSDAIEAVSPILTSGTYRRWLNMVPLEHMEVYNKCGLHIHIGFPEDWRALNRLMCYISWHRREIIALTARSREPMDDYDNTGRPMQVLWSPAIYRSKEGFMRSIYGAEDWVYEPAQGHKCRGRTRMQMSKRANDNQHWKYPGPVNRSWWFNVHGYFHHNVVEIRLMHSTPVVEAIEAWIELWLSLLNKVPAMSVDSLKDVPISAIHPQSFRVLSAARNMEGDGQGHYYRRQADALVDMVREASFINVIKKKEVKK